ncbi:BZ3500_MvSof-1268-A1-R1_Chr2-2g04756 [Microbotryum saponariae]|uniref:BZ3500_MvSof-1268-A1-R1_Chr2-2g04756 protein n=1 Tax=Microbotryum saponariae TaxID=289078 RepID=A0A2X0N5S2_9BASI|nr:BZ3500_MvSof-1268-A1-R1_Chr2-2g04756 [Microbotryum saponariae]SDA00087.1 BZ3501_MvSof-1269-A2-R1_Chr2-2g04430 [Microbotryum saponariae]
MTRLDQHRLVLGVGLVIESLENAGSHFPCPLTQELIRHIFWLPTVCLQDSEGTWFRLTTMLPQTLQPQSHIPATASPHAQTDDEDAAAAERALIERRKMLAGEAYDAMQDQGLLEGRLRARHLLHAYNHHPSATYVKGMGGMDYFGPDSRWSILAELFQIPLEKMKKIAIEPPFLLRLWVQYQFYSNFGLTVLECAEVTFGDRVLVAPNVQVYAATHSVDVAERQAGLERAYPVTVGDDCWIGGSAVLIGPCHIGNGCTVAAGAVVRGTFPDNCVIGGTPARILKKLGPPSEQTKN